MTPPDFAPPFYKDTACLIFEKKPAPRLAPEQRGSLVQDDTMGKQLRQSNLIKVIADNLKKSNDELDVLVLDDPQALKAQIKKIDTKSRKPIFAKKFSKAKKQIILPRFDTP